MWMSSIGDDEVRLGAVVQNGGAIFSLSGSLAVSGSAFANTTASVTLTATPDHGSTADMVSLE